jgi:hypothetical protein
MEPIAVSHPVYKPPYDHFGRCIPAPDATHICRTLVRSKLVNHGVALAEELDLGN